MEQKRANVMMFKLTLMLSPTRSKRTSRDVEYMYQRDTVAHGSEIALKWLYRNVFDAVVLVPKANDVKNDNDNDDFLYYFNHEEIEAKIKEKQQQQGIMMMEEEDQHKMMLGNDHTCLQHKDNYILTKTGPYAWDYMQNRQSYEDRYHFTMPHIRQQRAEKYANEYLIPSLLLAHGSTTSANKISKKWQHDIDQLIAEYEADNNALLKYAKTEPGDFLDTELLSIEGEGLVQFGYISQLKCAQAAVAFLLHQIDMWYAGWLWLSFGLSVG